MRLTSSPLPAGPTSPEPPRRRAKRIGRTEQEVLLRLGAPVVSPTLCPELGVSPQRVDQVLKSLLKQGKVARFPKPGAARRWLWVRSDVDADQFLRNHVPALPPIQAAMLNVLAPDTYHAIADIAAAIGSERSHVASRVPHLEARGLVRRMRLGRQRNVSITQTGLDHPSRTASAARAPAADLSKAFPEPRVAFLETLGVLSTARTIDITAALAGDERPATGLMSAQYMAYFLKSGLAEPVPGQHNFCPAYRLTEAGVLVTTLMARSRVPPGRELLERRVASYRQQQADRLRRASRQPPRTAVGSPAQQAVLDALGAGPLSSLALRRVVAPYARHPRSIQCMLKSLAQRGAVRSIGRDGKAKIWSLACEPGDGGLAGHMDNTRHGFSENARESH